MMPLGSLFDGIGGWFLAARHAGVTPVWASEIEPFPCSVTARHGVAVRGLCDTEDCGGDSRCSRRSDCGWMRRMCEGGRSHERIQICL